MSLKYLNNLWRTLEIPLITCEINLILTWLATGNSIICEVDRKTTFVITDTNIDVPLNSLSTQYNTKLPQQLKSGFKGLIDSSFQGVNRLFVLSFEDTVVRTVHIKRFLPKV